LGAYTSDEVIDYLKNIEKVDNEEILKIYSFEKISGKIDENSIRVKYKNSILKYYGQNDSQNLQGKRSWIEQRVNNGK
jgi:hypothetical protein